MKTINVRDLQRGIRKSIRASQGDRVVVTRNGEPAAVLIGVEGQDWEDVVLQTSASFWRLIEARRKQGVLTLAEMRRRLRAKRPGQRR